MAGVSLEGPFCSCQWVVAGRFVAVPRARQLVSCRPKPGEPLSPTPRAAPRVLLAVAIGFVLLHLATQTLRIVGGYGSQRGLEQLFNLDRENNLPTWYSSALLLGAAILAGTVAAATRRGGQRHPTHWAAISLLLAGMSADEIASLHSRTGPAVGALLSRIGIHGGGFSPDFYWVVPGIILVAIVAAAFWPFFRDLPAPTRRSLFLAAVVFVAGAIGVEIYEGTIVDPTNPTMQYAVAVAVEEGCEMVGVVMAIQGILSHLARPELTPGLVRLAESIAERH